MKTTVIVVPRERFSSITASLISLFSTIPDEVPVIVVEGRTPQRIRRELRNIGKRRSFTHVALDRLVTPNEARNIGAKRADTPLLVFADNDMQYEPGWLEALERNIESTGAGAVAPMTFIGPPCVSQIHQAGSNFVVYDQGGKPGLKEAHRLPNASYDEVKSRISTLAPVENEIFEFHCMMIRRSVYQEMGGFDERLISRDHLDASLRVRALGHKVTFEKDSHVTQRAFDPIELRDLVYSTYRWADHRAVQSMDAFEETWGVALPRAEVRWGMIARRRFRCVELAFPMLCRLLPGRPARVLLLKPIEAYVAWLERRSRRTAPTVGAAPRSPGIRDITDLLDPDRTETLTA